MTNFEAQLAALLEQARADSLTCQQAMTNAVREIEEFARAQGRFLDRFGQFLYPPGTPSDRLTESQLADAQTQVEAQWAQMRRQVQ